MNGDPRTKEMVALWLRCELKELRNGEGTVGEAPVLKGKALSRLVIADAALTMLESVDMVGDELLLLFQELLQIDRRRKALATSHSDKLERAALFECSVNRTPGLREPRQHLCRGRK